MSFSSTPLGQGRRLDHRAFLNKPTSSSAPDLRPPNSPPTARGIPTSYAYGAPTLGTRSPPKPTSSRAFLDPDHDQASTDSVYTLQNRNHLASAPARTGPRVITEQPNPEKWSVKNTSVNIATAFHQAATSSTTTTTTETMQNIHDPNASWASGSSRSRANHPRSTSKDYEESATVLQRRLVPGPNGRLAAPRPPNSQGQNGSSAPSAQRRPLSKSHSAQLVPDSEGEGDAPTAPRNPRGKSPFEALVSAVQQPVTFLMRPRQPPSNGDTSHAGGDSYSYENEEREVQAAAQKPKRGSSGSVATHKRNRMSLDNKAYKPTAEDEYSDDDEVSDGGSGKKKRRKAKRKEAGGGPLTTLPVTVYDKKRRRRRGGKDGATAEDGEEEDEDEESGSDDQQSEQHSMRGPTPVPSRSSVPRPSQPPLSRGSVARAQVPIYDSSNPLSDESMASAEQGLHSIAESAEEGKELSPPVVDPDASQDETADSRFSVGVLLGRFINLVWRIISGVVMLVFRVISYFSLFVGWVLGSAFDVLLQRPTHWVGGHAGFFAQAFKYLILAVGMYGAWYALHEPITRVGSGLLAPRPGGGLYFPSAVPAGDVSELADRLVRLESALSGLSLESVRERSRADRETRTREELQAQIGTLEKGLREAARRAAEAEEMARKWQRDGLRELTREMEALQAKVAALPKDGSSSASDEEARAQLRAMEQRLAGMEGGVKEALELGRTAVKTDERDRTSHAWWHKLAHGTAADGATLTIKASDGQDVTSLIGHLVDNAVSKYNKDILARPDFALHSGGATVIPSLTSDTYEIRPHTLSGQLIGMMTGSGYAIGRQPVTALHHETHIGHCWPFAGSQGQLGVKLAAPTFITDVTIDHVAAEVAFDLATAPREMELWGLVEGDANHARARAYWAEKAARAEEARVEAELRGDEPAASEVEEYPRTLPKGVMYLRLARFAYDIHSPSNIQTFPVDAEVRALGIDFGVVALRIRSNWGMDEFTCLYRLRVHGDRLQPPGKTLPAHEDSSAPES